MPRPNILYIHSHDSGRYTQPYGYGVPTPRIQQLAQQGVLFRQAFCAAPTCSPSRASLLTGQCAHSSGMIGLAHRSFALNDYSQHIVHTLRSAGYTSTLIGVQHVANDAARIGYDQVLPLTNHDAEYVAPAAVEWLRHAPAQPFFVSVGFNETHREFHEPGPREDARYTLPPRTLPDTPETRRDMAAFTASARILDEGIGAVLDALDATGLAENTLVICTTDHGIAFPGMKCNLTDHGIGVMLIMRGPGGFVGGQVCEALVSHIDIFPTLCELIGIARPAWLQGKSLMPLMRGEASEVNDAIYAEVTYHAAYEPQRAIRTRRWKYIRRYDGRTRPVRPNLDDGLSKEVWLRNGWGERAPEAEQLYDLVFDPNEARNLAADPACQATLADLRAQLERWMRATNDPLLSGPWPVPAPRGAEVNDVDDLSPRQPTIVL
jgi:N-sulfoglucosamine sulfohydrolase